MEDLKIDSYRHDHAVVFFVGTAASEEPDGEDDDSNDDQQDRRRIELTTEEDEIVAELSLDKSSGHDQHNTSQLLKKQQ